MNQSLYNDIALLQNLYRGWERVHDNDGTSGEDQVSIEGSMALSFFHTFWLRAKYSFKGTISVCTAQPSRRQFAR